MFGVRCTPSDLPSHNLITYALSAFPFPHSRVDMESLLNPLIQPLMMWS